MAFDTDRFALEMVNEVLWWRYSVDEPDSSLVLSDAFLPFFVCSVKNITDLIADHESFILSIKIQEILDSPYSDVRFAVSYNTVHGKRTFQHQLKTYVDLGQRYVWASCIDVTESAHLEREMVNAQGRLSVSKMVEKQALLEEQNRFINDSYIKQSRFLAMLSHELRSPLLGISSLVSRLREHETDDVKLNALKTIQLTAEQSIFLVNDILTYSQTEYDEVTLHPQVFSLKEVLENVKQLTKSIANDKGLIVSLVYLGEQDKVWGDRVRLSQILINLIVNSIKFTQCGGVTVEVRWIGESRCSFSVTDSGEGISKDKQSKIFEPFAQLETTGSTQSMGSGLGLFVVNHLVRLMGGTISVSSKIDVGSTFSFELVLRAVEQDGVDFEVNRLDASKLIEQNKLISGDACSDLPKTPKTSKTLKGQIDAQSDLSQTAPLNILIADDSKINRMVLSGYLQDLDCIVFEAQDGQQAWDLFQQNSIDYVFLDIQMPFMDGIEVSQKIKQAKNQGKGFSMALKGVYAITAGGDEFNFIPKGESLESIGFTQWFVKPVSNEQVLGVLGTAIKAGAEAATFKDDMLIKDTFVADERWDDIKVVPNHFEYLMPAFLDEMNVGLREMPELLQAKDWKGIMGKSHYLKGNCMLFQLNHTVELLRVIETIAKDGLNGLSVSEKMIKVFNKLKFAMKQLEN